MSKDKVEETQEKEVVERRIKLLKPEFLNVVVKELEDKIGIING